MKAGAQGLYNVTPGELHPIPSELSSYFGPGYHRYGVHDDGSCFFHTICAALNIAQYRDRKPSSKERIGRQFRRLMQHELSKENWNEVWKDRKVVKASVNLPTISKMNTMMGNYRTWADVYMILYVMDRMKLNMLFFDASSDSLYCGVRGTDENQKRTVFVMWVNHAHFEPIVHENEQGELTCSFNADHEQVKKVMHLYHTQRCPGEQDNVHHLLSGGTD